MSNELKEYTFSVNTEVTVQARSRYVAESRATIDVMNDPTLHVENIRIIDEPTYSDSDSSDDDEVALEDLRVTICCPTCGWEIIPYTNISETQEVYKCNNADCEEGIVKRSNL